MEILFKMSEAKRNQWLDMTSDAMSQHDPSIRETLH